MTIERQPPPDRPEQRAGTCGPQRPGNAGATGLSGPRVEEPHNHSSRSHGDQHQPTPPVVPPCPASRVEQRDSKQHRQEVDRALVKRPGQQRQRSNPHRGPAPRLSQQKPGHEHQQQRHRFQPRREPLLCDQRRRPRGEQHARHRVASPAAQHQPEHDGRGNRYSAEYERSWPPDLRRRPGQQPLDRETRRLAVTVPVLPDQRLRRLVPGGPDVDVVVLPEECPPDHRDPDRARDGDDHPHHAGHATRARLNLSAQSTEVAHRRSVWRGLGRSRST